MREVEGTRLGADAEKVVIEIETRGLFGRRRDRMRLHPAMARQLSDDLLRAVAEHDRAHAAMAIVTEASG